MSILFEFITHSVLVSIERLKKFDPIAGKTAEKLLDQLNNSTLPNNKKTALENILSNFATKSAEADYWRNPEIVLSHALAAVKLNAYDESTLPFVRSLKQLAYSLHLSHTSPVRESVHAVFHDLIAEGLSVRDAVKVAASHHSLPTASVGLSLLKEKT